MERVTVEQCQQVVRDNHLTWLGHHKCTLCNVMVGYVFDSGDVWFDPTCGCSVSMTERRTWAQFADTFNMQTPEARRWMWERFNAGKALYEREG